MNNIQWLFFYIGSTLVDESTAYEHRIKDTVRNSSISYERFYNMMSDLTVNNIKDVNSDEGT